MAHGMGAQKAAWQAAFDSECAALTGTNHAQSLLDLVKAFETVPHEVLAVGGAAPRFALAGWFHQDQQPLHHPYSEVRDAY